MFLAAGELQRTAVAAALSRETDVYMFDEPSSYLDVKQRLQVAKAIRRLKDAGKTIIVAEHDLAIIDYLSTRSVSFMAKLEFTVLSATFMVFEQASTSISKVTFQMRISCSERSYSLHEKPPATSTGGFEPLLKWNRIEKNPR